MSDQSDVSAQIAALQARLDQQQREMAEQREQIESLEASLGAAGNGTQGQRPRGTTGRRSMIIKTAGVAASVAAVAAGAPVAARALTQSASLSNHPQSVAIASAAGTTTLLSTPIRLLDTRDPPISLKLAAGKTLTLKVTGVSVGGISIPDGASGVFGNVTIVSPDNYGLLILFPADSAAPTTSNLNYFSNSLVLSNFAIVGLSANGQMNIYCNNGSTHVLFDAAGYIS